MIAPGERVTVVMAFESESRTQRQEFGGIASTPVDPPGSTFSFSAQCVSFTPSGTQRIAIGLPAIKAAAVRK